MFSLTRKMFSFWENEGLRTTPNPTRGVELAHEEARDRTLSTDELGALAEALAEAEARSPAAVNAIKVAALTGLRIGEVLAIRWEHVDFDSGRLTMPDTKTGRRVHDLPAPALAVLADIPRINAYAFTSGRERDGEAPITYRTARAIFAACAAAAGLRDAKLHDLRRTVITLAAVEGVSSYVLRDLLGHKSARMADRYIRRLSAPVREARERIGGVMAGTLGAAL